MARRGDSLHDKEWDMRPNQDADIEYGYNNGTVAVRPGLGGRLRHRSLFASNGDQDDITKVWIFADVTTYTDDHGNEIIDHHRRGIRVGSFNDWVAFKHRCRQLGITVAYAALYVPCSNGQRRHGKDNKGELMNDYPVNDLRDLRFDLESPETLAEQLRD